jgi:hypothetical protein
VVSFLHFDRGTASGWLPRSQVPRDWCRRAMVTHRVVAWVAASAALYACALMVASPRRRDALSPAGVTIATLVYANLDSPTVRLLDAA